MTALPLTVWIIEDNARYRRSLVRLLGAVGGIRCAFDCGSCETALERLLTGKDPAPDILLLDLGLPGMGGIAGIPRLREAAPGCDIVVLTVSDDKVKVFEAIAAGATGYLLKSSGPEEITQALRDVAKGGSPLTPQIARYVLTSFSARIAPTPETALSPHTVDYHVRKIYKKLHVNNISSAVSRALKEGLI
jgi:DNA-binding NarL/FixJ family response regulator